MNEQTTNETTQATTQQEGDAAEAIRRLLEIAELAEFYAPGELGEFPDQVHADIEFARTVLAGLTSTDHNAETPVQEAER